MPPYAETAAITTQSSATPRVPTVSSAPWMRRDRHWLRPGAPFYSRRGSSSEGGSMIFEGTTTIAEGLLERLAMQSTRKLADERGTASRKHFLDAYAEHLKGLNPDRPTK